jgi:transcriptional regulator with XRE-family HTH domain
VPVTTSPTARRRELGSMLRSLRVGTGLTAEEVAQRLGCSRSKISRLETGQRGASRVDILQLCELYQVEEKHRARLTELAAEGRQRGWWRPLSLPYSDYIGLESEAASISDYGLAIVPGLLQTAEYARAILRAGNPGLAPEIVEERVQARTARRVLLRSRKVPRFDAVLDESVLHRIVESPAVMLAQLEQLLDMSEWPNVTIRVVPYGASIVPSGVNKFIILKFERLRIDDIVQIEELAGQQCIAERKIVERYDTTFRTLTSLSADPSATRAMIRTQMDTYKSKIR